MLILKVAGALGCTAMDRPLTPAAASTRLTFEAVGKARRRDPNRR